MIFFLIFFFYFNHLSFYKQNTEIHIIIFFFLKKFNIYVNTTLINSKNWCHCIKSADIDV